MSLSQKQNRVGLNGDEAVAYAVLHADVDVISAYPITPQTIIAEKLSEFVHNGELDAEFVPVESEHSALSVAVGAALAGARTFTATASQGLALMYEILYITSSLRLPIVMVLGNRAFSAPINIHCSHDDAYAARDAGWIQFFAENVQEAYDLTLISFMVAEDENISFPTIVNLDGFILTHSVEPLNIFIDKEVVREFLPHPERTNIIDPSNPKTYGPLALSDYYMEIKKQIANDFLSSFPHIEKAFDKFGRFSGRKYSFIKPYLTKDAETIFIVLGSTAGTMRHMVKEWRSKGEKVGLISLTLYRPFPTKPLVDALEGADTVVVMDRSYSYGSSGAQLFLDVAGALMKNGKGQKLFNVIYGLGGRDFTPDMANQMLRMVKKSEKKEIWIGVRSD